jgi:phage tail sheath protein FI
MARDIPSSNKPIEGVATSIAAFVGIAPGGPSNTPVRVRSWAQFATLYGDPDQPGHEPYADDAFLAHAVRGFFDNGGTCCWIVRTQDLAGDVAERRGLGALAAVDEITIVCVPDAVAPGRDEAGLRALQAALITHCENAGDRMAILDPPPALDPRQLLEWRRGAGAHDSKHAVLYWPWLEVTEPAGGHPMLVPPSGHVAGAWCRSDVAHQAAEDDPLRGLATLAYDVGDDDSAKLAEAGVNSIRSFPGRGIRVWGSRTLSSDPEWRYVPVRRLFLQIAESLDEGLRWVVFEPNNERLWARLRRSAEDFLERRRREGALAGEIPEEAYFVRCDEETNPPDLVDAGQVVCVIGIALVRPREFVSLRLSWALETAGRNRRPR